jgi:hypothetical protein
VARESLEARLERGREVAVSSKRSGEGSILKEVDAAAL